MTDTNRRTHGLTHITAPPGKVTQRQESTFKPEAGGSAAHDNTPLADCCGRAWPPHLHFTSKTRKTPWKREPWRRWNPHPPSHTHPSPWPQPDLLAPALSPPRPVGGPTGATWEMADGWWTDRQVAEGAEGRVEMGEWSDGAVSRLEMSILERTERERKRKSDRGGRRKRRREGSRQRERCCFLVSLPCLWRTYVS